MHVFETLTFNLKQIRFADNKEYFDSLLKEFDLSYSDVAFCFTFDPEGKISERVIKQFPELKPYRKYYEKTDLLGRVDSDFHLSSICTDEENRVTIHMKHQHIQSFECLLKKIPRPFHFAFMGVVLDHVIWDKGIKSKPYFTPNALGSIVPSHSFSTYYSNSIRFFKEFDYGNKLNLVELMVERIGNFTQLSPLPPSFGKICACLGKPMDRELRCIFSAEEENAFGIAKHDVEQMIARDAYDLWFASFARQYPATWEGIHQVVSDELTPVKGFSMKRIFGGIAKKYGYQYAGCHNGDYVFRKCNLHNHEFQVIVSNVPFHSTLEGSMSVTGYNFTFGLISTPRIIIADGETAGAYCEKVFEAAKETEDKFSEKLFSLYGQTPEWFWVETE